MFSGRLIYTLPPRRGVPPSYPEIINSSVLNKISIPAISAQLLASVRLETDYFKFSVHKGATPLGGPGVYYLARYYFSCIPTISAQLLASVRLEADDFQFSVHKGAAPSGGRVNTIWLGTIFPVFQQLARNFWRRSGWKRTTFNFQYNNGNKVEL